MKSVFRESNRRAQMRASVPTCSLVFPARRMNSLTAHTAFCATCRFRISTFLRIQNGRTRTQYFLRMLLSQESGRNEVSAYEHWASENEKHSTTPLSVKL